MPELALTMPKMSMTMDEGTMVAWIKQPGDTVRSGEVVCEVATDKVDMEVESPYEGVVARLVAEVGEVVHVGDPIAYITTEEEDLLGGLFDAPGGAAETATPVAAVAEAEAAPVASVPGADTHVRAVPLARSLATEYGIDLHTVTPTGPWRTVRVADVEAVTGAIPVVSPSGPQPILAPPPPVPVTPPVPPATAPTTAPAPAPASAAPAEAPARAETAEEGRRRRLRTQVARVMTESALIPQFTAYADLDLDAAAAVRQDLLGGVSWTVILLRAHAVALSRVPALCAHWADGAVAADDGIGVALAVDSPTGLVAPVIRDPQRRPLAEVAAEVSEIVAAARAGSLRLDQFSGGTTVLSNLGGMGVRQFNALITPPHASALSVGAVADRVDVVGGGAGIGVRRVCTVGLTVDHRVADGADAGRYVAELVGLFREPERIAEIVR